MLERQQKISNQFDMLANNYSDIKKKNEFYYKHLLLAIRRHVGEVLHPILEIGCGAGDILNHISSAPGLGLDISGKMVEIAKINYPLHEFQCQALGEINIKHRFETIVLADVLEYIDNLDDAFKNLASLLKPGGRCVLTSPNPLWFRILQLSTILGLKMEDVYSNPPSYGKIIEAAKVNGLSLESFSTELVIPKNIPILRLINHHMDNKLLLDKGVMMVIVLSKISVK